jgi:hypothetical protein
MLYVEQFLGWIIFDICPADLLDVVCFRGVGFAGNLGGLCIGFGLPIQYSENAMIGFYDAKIVGGEKTGQRCCV